MPAEASGARLRTTWAPPTGTISPGEHSLGQGRLRDGFLYVPGTYDRAVPAPLLVLLHGAKGKGDDWNVAQVLELVQAQGMVLLAPDSRGVTWDLVEDSVFTRDARFIEEAITRTFRRCNIDPARIGVAGFSDGATYALSLGLANGDLFSGLIAFSPGYMSVERPQGKPRIFMAHGLRDQVLPYRNSRGIENRLRLLGYDVTFREFDGGHVVKREIAAEAFQWLTSPLPGSAGRQ